MKKKLENSLLDALSYCNLKDLPPKENKEYVWIKSLALVRKMDGCLYYALCSRDKDGNPKVMKDFGGISVIKEVIDYYPMLYLDERYMPTFKTKTKEERIEWLKQMGSKDDLSELSVKELNKKVLNMSMQIALRALNKK